MATALFARNAIGEIGGDRYPIFLSLIGFNHQQDPKNEANQAHNGQDEAAQRPGSEEKASHHPSIPNIEARTTKITLSPPKTTTD